MEKKVDVVIVGAGLTGLTTGYYLNKAGKSILIVDKADRWGGVIETHEESGFVYEGGPNTGVLSDVIMEDLFEEIQDENCQIELADTKKANKRYVVKNGKFVALPTGPFGGLLTPLFSWRDKFFGIPLEPFRKRGTNPDEPLAELVKRRMGKSMLDYAIDPFILGVYAGDPSQLVPKYALPKLYNLEQDYGSFIGGAIKKMIATKRKGERSPSRKIFSFKGGLQKMTDGIASKIGSDKFLLSLSDITVNKTDSGYQVTGTKAGETVTIEADKVVTACGGYALKSLLPFVPQEDMTNLSNTHYTKVIEVQLGFNKWNGRDLDGFGGLCPFVENRDILGILFMSATQTNRAPEGGALLTVFMGGMRRQDLIAKTDMEVKEIVAREVSELMEMPDFNPDMIKIHRYEHAIPQYGAESKVRFETIDKVEKENSGLTLGGNFCGGIGMSKRVVQGYEIARKLTT
jgi:oxygen-dependent protoporphyrinogen oxidase